MKTIIKDNQRGFLIRNGRFVRMLAPEKYRFLKLLGYQVLIDDIDGSVNTFSIPLEVLLKDQAFADSVLVVTKSEDTVTVLKKDGVPFSVPGGIRSVFWNTDGRLQAEIFSCIDPAIPDGFSKETLKILPPQLYTKIEIDKGMVGFLYFDGKFEKQLDPGTYFFWAGRNNVTCETVDVRRQQLEITGQEILTADRVSIRLNILADFRVTQPRLYAESVSDPQKQVYSLVQMTVRGLIGQKRFDEVLEQKELMADSILELLTQKQDALGVEFLSAGIKDIILPGDIREIMNSVLVAEKTAQANVIARREEVASTRSLLNTARLMEENQTLYKLKELEYLERICDKVGSITVDGREDLLSQLTAIMSGGKA